MVRRLEDLGVSGDVSRILDGETIQGTNIEEKQQYLDKKKDALLECNIQDILTYYAKLTDPADKSAMESFISKNISLYNYYDTDLLGHIDIYNRKAEYTGLDDENEAKFKDLQKSRISHLELIDYHKQTNKERVDLLKKLLNLGDVDKGLLESFVKINENANLLEEIKIFKEDWEKDPTDKDKKKAFLAKKRELRKKVSEKFFDDRKKLHDVLFRNYTYDSTDFNEIDSVNRRKGTVETRRGDSVEMKYSFESRIARRRLNRAIEELNKIDSDHPEKGVNFLCRKALWGRKRPEKLKGHIIQPLSWLPVGYLTSIIKKKHIGSKDRDTFEKAYDDTVKAYLKWIGIDKITESDADEIIDKVEKKFDAIKEAYKQKIVKLI